MNWILASGSPRRRELLEMLSHRAVNRLLVTGLSGAGKSTVLSALATNT